MEYPPNTPHHILAGLPRHLHFKGRMFALFNLKDPDFSPFRASLAGETKQLQESGVGAKKRQAEIITPEEKPTM